MPYGQGANAYLRRQYRMIAIVFGIIFLVFVTMAFFGLISPLSPFTFVLGGLFSAGSGIIGMNTATKASSRTAQATSKSLNDGLQVAFRGGSVMGLTVVGFRHAMYHDHVFVFGICIPRFTASRFAADG
jgi:K(+)-stimulated pyrophosphate-energized sodium pump